jgi:plasmid maintenance system killer protein
MEVDFANDRVRALCGDVRKFRRKHGEPSARKLRARLADLRAARTLEDLRDLPGRCHELLGADAGSLALDLAGGLRLIFRPAEDPPPSKADGGLDWGQVRSIQILEVTDYH